jgi:2'-5' RNA ligase
VPPSGVISLLDGATEAKVVEIMGELRTRFGVHAVADVASFPHVSYQVADEFVGVSEALARIATRVAPFSIYTSCLGLFPGPVVFVGVARSPALAALHAEVWAASLATAPHSYYDAAHWMPHITLAQHDVPVAILPEITSWLATRELAWEITIDTLAFAHWNGARYDIERHRLSGR